MHYRKSRPLLISGCSGWVGSELIKRCNTLNFSTQRLSRKAGGAHNQHPSVEFCSANGSEWTSNTVIHLAALVHQMPSAGRASSTTADYQRANREATLTLAHQAAMNGAKRFVFISTAKVMGDLGSRPFYEIDAPEPPDAYSRSKWDAEQGLAAAHQRGDLGDMECVVLRPPLVIGAGVGANFAQFLKLASSPFPLPLGAANQKRSMVSIENLVNAILFAASEQCPVGTYFVTDGATPGADMSVAQWITLIRQHQGRVAGLIPIPEVLMRSAFKAMNKANVAERMFNGLQFSSEKLRAAGWNPPRSDRAAAQAAVQAMLGAK
jgi:nucleoside-diphosphate-sugar epimerase